MRRGRIILKRIELTYAFGWRMVNKRTTRLKASMTTVAQNAHGFNVHNHHTRTKVTTARLRLAMPTPVARTPLKATKAVAIPRSSKTP